MRTALRIFIVLSFVVLPLAAQELPASMRAGIDNAVAGVLAKTGAPSASIAIVKDGKLAYAHAYGNARIDPPMPATPQMRYSIGSNSKQFTAAAILMLAEEGKISLDDKVVRWLPDLTRANEVTVRQLLSMTSGYQDFWPQDYVMPNMLLPVTAQQIADEWAKKPLDFEPGSKWQYSNTNYTLAGMIIEKVSGMPLLDFLQKRVFGPLQMTSVFNTDFAPLTAHDPERYLRYGGGPMHVAPKEGRGWLWAAGELAMTASDLAKWDMSMIDETVLKPASYRELERETLLTSGVGTHYGLGVYVNNVEGRRQVSHGGEVSGFTSRNEVYPDQRAAIIVFTNLDATDASSQIASKIAPLLFAATDPVTQTTLEQMKKIFADLQRGKIDRSIFTSNANAYFNETALKDFAATLGPLGSPKEFTQSAQSLRGGMTLRRYEIKFPSKTLRLTTFIMPGGKLEQYQIAAEE